jgi:hypothetical protein
MKWGWVERALAYDDYLDREVRKAALEERKVMAARHVEIAKIGETIVIASLQRILEKARDPTNPQVLSATEATRLFDISVKIERMARGEPTEIAHAQESPLEEFTRMGEAERRQVMIDSFMELGNDRETAEQLATSVLGGANLDGHVNGRVNGASTGP